ncbi:MAG: hypothetical protein EPO51_13065 [Phenylobacterium sp.]|uniref:hypothetical protein n=1 Tax=Phenylobacterium sp. TaxID=1871053 RepID=UPI001217E657|nr:hypothetical protein [Phenylobacterium sp.]TAJ71230.1 MAG: hypothetical protein EPO51_13065 [Phenylobacterium sp.]
MRIRLALLAALIAAPALAAEPDAPVATAPAQAETTAPAASTAQQIDDFIKTSPVPDARRDDALDGVVPRDDGKPHGEISVSVGTGGYRSVYGRTEIPVGKNGRVSLAFEDTKGGYYGYGRRGYGGPYAGGPLGIGGGPDRQRCDLEGMGPVRPLDTVVAPLGRCARPLSGW